MPVPRENPAIGYKSFPAEVQGTKQRIRSETFSDHYSQARLFFISQQPIEQKHIGDALVFELSKVERVDIRARAVSHLRNIDEGLAATVADGLGLGAPGRRQGSQADAGLAGVAQAQHRRNGPASFKGRKLGILLTDGSAALLARSPGARGRGRGLGGHRAQDWRRDAR
jgi:catalase